MSKCYCDNFDDPRLLMAIYVYDGKDIEVQSSGQHQGHLTARARKACNSILAKAKEVIAEINSEA